MESQLRWDGGLGGQAPDHACKAIGAFMTGTFRNDRHWSTAFSPVPKASEGELWPRLSCPRRGHNFVRPRRSSSVTTSAAAWREPRGLLRSHFNSSGGGPYS